MAGKRVVAIQELIETDEDFETFLENHKDQVICLEVYSEVFGYCQATGNAVRKAKLEIGGDAVAMAKAPADKIEKLERFRHRSEPVFLYIRNHKLTKVLFGANGIELIRIMEEEIEALGRPVEGRPEVRKKKEVEEEEAYDITEITPYELEKKAEIDAIEKEAYEVAERLRTLTAAARKKRVCLRLAEKVKRMNFIMFWPHNHQAHYDLYEKWDIININVAAKETFQLDEEMAKEALYMSDVDLNEACLYALTTGEALVVLFKMFETDNRDFVKLLRYALYEDIPEPKEDLPPEKQLPPIPAYERYASISKTAREVRRDRYNAKLQKLQEEQEERDRLQREQERLAREEREEQERLLKIKQEEEKMARIAAGLPAEPEPEELPPEPEQEEGAEQAEGAEEKAVSADVAEGEEGGEPHVEGEHAEGEHAEEEEPKEEEFNSDVEVEDEDYIPPGGLFVPGLYCPPNELAKANGLKLFFPKNVMLYANVQKLESDIMPPHMLIMFTVDKRHEVLDIASQFPDEILNIGFFMGDEPENLQHVAFTLRQYEKMERMRKHLDRLALQVSRKRSLPMLQLAGLNPVYLSTDVDAGERECLTVFPVGYGDEYVEEESVKEEEIEEEKETAPTEVEEAPPPEEEEIEEEELDI